jgi:hypothetical protein
MYQFRSDSHTLTSMLLVMCQDSTQTNQSCSRLQLWYAYHILNSLSPTSVVRTKFLLSHTHYIYSTWEITVHSYISYNSYGKRYYKMTRNFMNIGGKMVLAYLKAQPLPSPRRNAVNHMTFQSGLLISKTTLKCGSLKSSCNHCA